MNQKLTLGSAVVAASLLLSQIGLAQSVVYSDCSSGTCSPSSGACVGGHCLGAGGGMFGPNTGEHGTMKAWAWHSSWGDYWARNQAMQRPWHGGYYWMRTGQPTALVVPPVVTMQQNYSWGVSQNTMTPVYHQFGGVAPNGAGGGMFRGTPYWPTHTEQFGVYPVRGPW
ncbi:MAG: hypothetical protein MUF23_10815 [Pirellula sp.]|nr:hypothetical protein [Pirellula sp.]